MRKPKQKVIRKKIHEQKLLASIAPEYIRIGAFADYSEDGVLPSYSLKRIFAIQEDELNAFGLLFSKKTKNNDKYGEKIDGLALAAFAYQQFQDLMDLTFSSIDDVEKTKEHFFHRNYLYYESLVYLRTISLDILNANALGALALLRPYSELSVFFLYFRYLSEKKGIEKLYGWMKGQNGKPPFMDALQYVINEQKENNPEIVDIIDAQFAKLAKCYKELSSYNHTPRVNESIGQMSGGYGPAHLKDIFYAILCATEITKSLNILFSLARPMILFPCNEIARFGFNGPVGIFADSTNNVIFEKCFDKELVLRIRNSLAKSDEVISIIKYYESQREYSDEEIRASYKPNESEDSNVSQERTINELIARKKAQIRVLGWFMNYVSQKDINAAI